MKFFLEHWALVLVAAVSGAGLLWPAFQRRLAAGTVVNHLQATRLVNDRDALLLDVRTTDEFSRGHIAGSRNIPVESLEPRLIEVHKDKSKPIVVVCASGQRAVRAAAMLKAAGYAQAVVLEGGLGAWSSAGLPLTK